MVQVRQNRYFILQLFILIVAGRPLEAQTYFQQTVNHKIDVVLNPEKKTLSAFQEIEYINNSPNMLDTLFFLLYPNAYSGPKTELGKQLSDMGNFIMYNISEDKLGWIDSLDFRVNGNKVKWRHHPEFTDICFLILKEPILPKDTIIISTPFRVKIPSKKISRMGCDDNSFYVTQWYPKPAVYDRQGWHLYPYKTIGEFYYEFGNYDVSITRPAKYIIAGSGTLKNSEEELFLKQLADFTNKSYRNNNDTFKIDEPQSIKTADYYLEHATDFAFFVSDDYLLFRDTVFLTESKKKIPAKVFFHRKNKNNWEKSMRYVKDAVKFYSKEIGPYPFSQVTVVDGENASGAGMEYPSICLIGNNSNQYSLEQVIMHEIGHNWFYGALSNNERVHPWMDEGINSFYEMKYMYKKYPDLKLNQYLLQNSFIFSESKIPYWHLYQLGYLLPASYEADQPLNLHSDQYTSLNYGAIVYMKGAVAFNYLNNIIGNDSLQLFMQGYYNNWKNKHPSPKVFFKALHNFTDSSMVWYQKDVIGSTKKLDYSLRSVKRKNNSTFLQIRNKGAITGPCFITFYGEKQETPQKLNGFHKDTVIEIPPETKKIVVDPKWKTPEINRLNNQIKTHGLLKKMPEIEFKPFITLPNTEKIQIMYAPVAGWNYYDQWMPGLAFYNIPFPLRKFQYLVLPMYSSGGNDFSGLAFSEASFFTSSIFHSISPGVAYKKFHYQDFFNDVLSYQKYSGYVNFVFRKRIPKAKIRHNIEASIHWVKKEYPEYLNYAEEYNIATFENLYLNLNQIYEHKRTFNPFKIQYNIEGSTDYLKANIIGNYKITYNHPKKGLDMRLFLGKFLYEQVDHSNINKDYRFQLTGIRGYQDYKYNHYFLARSINQNSWLSQQFVNGEGGFKVPAIIGQTWNWMSTINITTTLPGKLPVKLFFDIGTFHQAQELNQNGEFFLMDYGIQLSIIPSIVDVYLPLGMSKSLADNIELMGKDRYLEKIRFTLQIEKLNPFNNIKPMLY